MSVNGSGESGAAHRLRIGELSRRTGVAVDTLRAWERRYGVLSPERSEGGYRLYTDADVVRVGAIQALIAEGLSAAEAAAQVRAQPPAAPAPMPSVEAGRLATRLREALERLDESNANAVLDEALAGLSLEFVIQTVIFPVLRDIGTEWESGRISIGKEHFATNLLRGRLLGLARGWGAGGGPWAVLACPPQERHDLGLICFGLALWRRGWRIALLGADSPIATIAETAGDLGRRGNRHRRHRQEPPRGGRGRDPRPRPRSPRRARRRRRRFRARRGAGLPVAGDESGGRGRVARPGARVSLAPPSVPRRIRLPGHPWTDPVHLCYEWADLGQTLDRA